MQPTAAAQESIAHAQRFGGAECASCSQPLQPFAVRLREMHNLRIRQSFVIVELHSNGLFVASGVEFDFTVSRKTGFAVSRNVEDVSKRRHRARFACWKGIAEFALCREAQDIAADFFPKDI